MQSLFNMNWRKGSVILSTAFAFGAFFVAATWCHLATAATQGATVTIALTTEPPNLDAAKATDAESFFVLGHTMEGLTRYDQNQKIAPAVAESWTISDKGATFKIRKTAKWSDGKPVTAKDFVYSWTTAVDPATASEYAFILYPIKNAEAINTRKLPVTQLGVKALDDSTVKIEFEKPCGYFLALTTFATYYPMREDVRRQFGDRYAADANSLVFNGPFMLTKWVHGASLRMEKNPHYWNAANIKLGAIDVPYITPDETARFNLFKDRKTDFLGLNKDNLANAQKENFKLNKFADGTLFYTQFNFRKGRVTANKNLRKAIQAILNPQEFVSRVVGIAGTTLGTRLVPSWMMGASKKFNQEYPVANQRQNIALAKKYLAEALKELGLAKVPPLVWLTGDSPLSAKEAEYFQNLYKTTLGIDLKIDKQIFKQRLAKAKAGDFDIVSAGWGPDYNDPMTFADLFASWNENNQGKWTNAEYDALIRKAQSTTVQKDRMAAMAQAEKLLLEELPIIPTYERTIMYTHTERLQGVVRRSVGFDPDYTFATVK